MNIDNIMKNIKRIHMIGIGGSGMFPIVQILHKAGYIISGSDNNEGSIIDAERAMGISVAMKQCAENIGDDVELVVYSAAIAKTNVELATAFEKELPTVERSELLGYLTRQYSNCICVSGTHGKTSTTAMLTQILLEAGLDPSAVIGGKLPAIGGYGRSGESEVMTCEACEYSNTFLHLNPDVAIILNIDEDHLDYFKTMENLISSFSKFAANTTKCLIINGDDENSQLAVKGISKKVVTFGLGEKNDYTAKNIKQLSPMHTAFELVKNGEVLCKLDLHIPGKHQILNAVAACAAAIEVGAEPEKLNIGLSNFRGAGRRFEVLGELKGVTIVDDYAHHPAEIAATLKAAVNMGYKSVWTVHQPFTYSRTSMLIDDFAEALAIADHVVLSEIMGGREENTYNIYTKDLAAKIERAVWFESFDEIADYVVKNAKPGDLVITMGCGDVYKCAHKMLERYN